MHANVKLLQYLEAYLRKRIMVNLDRTKRVNVLIIRSYRTEYNIGKWRFYSKK